MLCMACGGEMILVNVAQDDIMGVSGFEHHTFRCSECQVIERRLVFTKHGREGDAEPTPMQVAQPIMPARFTGSMPWMMLKPKEPDASSPRSDQTLHVARALSRPL